MSRLLGSSLLLVVALAGCRSALEEDAWRPAPTGAPHPAWRAAPAPAPAGQGRALPSTGRLTTRIHDVSDLTFGIPSFAAPEIGDLRRIYGGAGHGESDARVLERTSRWNEDELVDLIQRSIAPDTWDEEGVSITIQGGRLIVRHRG